MSAAWVWNENDELSSIASSARRLRSADPAALRSIPESILERAWQRLDEEEWDEDAADILLHAGCAGWDQDEVAGAMLLRRLYEQAFRRDHESQSSILDLLCARPLDRFRRDIQRAGLSESQVEANALEAIRTCYPETDHDPGSQVQASCVLLAYRHALLAAEPSGYAAASYALYEACALYSAGQVRAAREAVDFAIPALGRLDPEYEEEREQCTWAGTALKFVADAAERAGDHDGMVRQLREALRFLPPAGDARAATLFLLARESRRRGELAEAMRLLKEALGTPEADDLTRQVANLGLSEMRAELEANPAKLRVDATLAERLGIPASFAEELPEILSTLLAGRSVPEEDLRRLMSKLTEWIAYQKTRGQSQKAFSALVLMLKAALSIDDPRRLPVSYETILEQADALLPWADEAQALEYQPLRAVAENRISRFTLGPVTPFRLPPSFG